jgi:hypothetical protein
MPDVTINAKQVARIAREVRRASPEAWRVCRIRLREVGQDVADDVKAATSYSSRIPQSVKVRSTVAGNVRITVGGDQAPNAVPIENKGQGYVRHPVFGNREVWTNKNSRPAFLLPTFARRKDWALSEMEKAYMDTFERVWGGR